MLGIPIDKGPRKIWQADCWAFGNGVSFVRWLGDAVTNSRRELKDRASDERSVARARWPMLAVAIALTAFCLAPAAGAAHAAPASTHGVRVEWFLGVGGVPRTSPGDDQFFGSWANALGLTSANLSQGIDDVDEVVGSHAIYGSFSILNATAPTNSTRAIQLSSIWEYNYPAERSSTAHSRKRGPTPPVRPLHSST